MQVILTQDVEKVGDANQLIEVADGFARNYLVPRGLALPATKSAMANLENMRQVHERREAKLRDAAQGVASTLAGKTLKITARVGEANRLYGSVGTQDIADALKAQFGVDVERRQVVLEDAIREAGSYTVPVKLHKEVQVEIPVQVGAES